MVGESDARGGEKSRLLMVRSARCGQSAHFVCWCRCRVRVVQQCVMPRFTREACLDGLTLRHQVIPEAVETQSASLNE